MTNFSYLLSELLASNTFHVSHFFAEVIRLKKENNSRASLRSIAKALEMSPSMLSLVVQGKRYLSKEECDRLGVAFQLSKNGAKAFHLMNRITNSLPKEEHAEIVQKAKELLAIERQNKIQPQNFSMLRDWRYLALIDYLKLYSVKSPEGVSISMVAKGLRITKKDAEFLLIELLDRKLVEKTKLGYLPASHHENADHEQVTNDFLSYFNQIHEQSRNYMQRQLPDTEYVGVISLPSSPEKLAAAKELIQALFLKLRVLSESEPDANREIYTGLVHWFPLVGNGED